MTIILPGTNLEPFFLIPKLRLNETMKKKWQKAQHGKPEFCVEQKKIETWFEKKKMKKSRRWWLQAVGASNEDGSRLTLASFSSSYANEMRLDGWSEDDFDQPHTGDGSLLDGQSKPPATESALRVILRLVAGIKKKKRIRKTNKEKSGSEKRGEKRRKEEARKENRVPLLRLGLSIDRWAAIQ